jgi:hypothetical protein
MLPGSTPLYRGRSRARTPPTSVDDAHAISQPLRHSNRRPAGSRLPHLAQVVRVQALEADHIPRQPLSTNNCSSSGSRVCSMPACETQTLSGISARSSSLAASGSAMRLSSTKNRSRRAPDLRRHLRRCGQQCRWLKYSPLRSCSGDSSRAKLQQAYGQVALAAYRSRCGRRRPLGSAFVAIVTQPQTRSMRIRHHVGHDPSASPVKTESACCATSSGMSVACMPPITTGTRAGEYSSAISYGAP